VPDFMAVVARGLNLVQSVGEERAALRAALDEIDQGFALAARLSGWTASYSPDEASDRLTVLRVALNTEIRFLQPRADIDPVDPNTWARARTFIERAYAEVDGIAGALGSVAGTHAQAGDILADAIQNAPKVFGHAVGAVVSGVGEAAGSLAGGLLGGLGVVGVLVLVLLTAAILRARLT
jgi:hypothetical protein